MKGLVLKDLFNILNNIKSLILTIIILSFIMLTFMNSKTYVMAMTIIFNMFILTTMTYDENSNWDQYAISLPISLKNIVISKYIVMSIFSTSGAMISGFIVFISSLLFRSILINQLYIFIPIAVLLALFLGSIMMPFIFKYGVEKTRTLISLIIIIPIALGYIFFNIFNFFNILYSKLIIVIIICILPIILLITIILSIIISVKIYSKKEF